MSVCLVTGGAGFIGSHVADALVLDGHEVIVLDNLSSGKMKNINNKVVRCYYRDITTDLNYIFERYNIDYIFHLAAHINLRESIKKPANDAYTNIYGSLNLIEMAIKYNVKKFIFSSTGGAIYSPVAELPWTTETHCDPQSPYGLSKLTTERYLKLAKQNSGLEFVCLRYSNVYGPRQDALGEAGVISIFIEQAIKNNDLKVFGDGEQTRDFIYVDDVVKANKMSLSDQVTGTFNVCTNTSISVNQLATTILSNIQTTSKVKYLEPIKGEVKHTQLCYNKFLNYGWAPSVQIEEGLNRTIKYFTAQK